MILRGEYYQSYPTFDIASIYSVFAVNQYKEKSIAAEYQLTEQLPGQRQIRQGEISAMMQTADVYEVGFLAQPIKDLTLNAIYEKRNGFAGQLSGYQALRRVQDKQGRDSGGDRL